ncbi:MAG: uroporphyrinogen decarboxylase family protein [Desulfobacterales bacterium]|nr:uroporphyrinogen decarboxylase family protein [Desulfobacterales bacterium]
MNSIERVVAAVSFNKTDRVPVIAQVFGQSAVLAGIPLDHYLRSGELIAKCQIKALEYYGYDAVFALMDVNVETEAAGSILNYVKDDYATITKYAINESTNIDALKIPHPEKDGRMPELLKAAKLLRSEVGNEVVVVGTVLGPLTIATQLLSMEKAFYLAADDPMKFEKILDYATEICITFGIAQIQAGAHLPIVFNPSASPVCIPPQFFKEFELPRLQKVFTKFKEAGAAANWLHIAGPVQSIVQTYPEAGVNIINFDYCVSAEEIQQLTPTTCVDGNIKSLSFEEASPEEIESEAMNLIKIFSNRGGFILSSGCEIPPKSKPENITALMSASRKMANG